jgi:hypothetical protein
MCFDINGLVYLSGDAVIARYDPISWREVPWDYGEPRKGQGFGPGGRQTDLVSALVAPGSRQGCWWHLGGIDISVKGHLTVTTWNGTGRGQVPSSQGDRGRLHANFTYQGKPYEPPVYPGRARGFEVHIWDEHGKVVVQDAAPGMTTLNGIGIDSEDNLYMLAASHRVIDGKPADPGSSGALVKMAAGKAKALSTGGWVPVPLSEETQPKRSRDLSGNYLSGWVEGADWLYGGIGFASDGCICWNSRFDLDYFNRSFAPETAHYSVAVLDSSGNLILRIGKYGNVDDGKPLILEGGPANPRSIGGDEVGLFYAAYVASHTDRRLFIADAGNARILSVKLGYHAEEKVALKDVKDQAK